jgi:hypothetical protein
VKSGSEKSNFTHRLSLGYLVPSTPQQRATHHSKLLIPLQSHVDIITPQPHRDRHAIATPAGTVLSAPLPLACGLAGHQLQRQKQAHMNTPCRSMQTQQQHCPSAVSCTVLSASTSIWPYLCGAVWLVLQLHKRNKKGTHEHAWPQHASAAAAAALDLFSPPLRCVLAGPPAPSARSGWWWQMSCLQVDDTAAAAAE